MSYDNYKQLAEQTIAECLELSAGNRDLENIFSALDARFNYMEHELEVRMESVNMELDLAAEKLIKQVEENISRPGFKLFTFNYTYSTGVLFTITSPISWCNFKKKVDAVQSYKPTYHYEYTPTLDISFLRMEIFYKHPTPQYILMYSVHTNMGRATCRRSSCRYCKGYSHGFNY